MSETKNQVAENKVVKFMPARGRDEHKKMLKMKDDPTMCMKTKGRLTKCPATDPPFSTRNARTGQEIGARLEESAPRVK